MAATRRDTLYLLAAAMHAYDRVHALEDHDAERAERQRRADHDHILKPPAPRGYGYATADDLAGLGINPGKNRQIDLEHWRHDLEMAVDAGLITQTEGEAAWQSANRTSHTSTSSTGTASTTAPTSTTKPSSKVLPIAVAGRRSPQQRKQANRPSSSPSRWQPQQRGAS